MPQNDDLISSLVVSLHVTEATTPVRAAVILLGGRRAEADMMVVARPTGWLARCLVGARCLSSSGHI